MKFLARLFLPVYLQNRLLFTLIIIVFTFCLGFVYPVFLALGKIALLSVIFAVVVELTMLFRVKDPLHAQRQMDNKLSNGDNNRIQIDIQGKYGFKTNLRIVDEFPEQLQLRDEEFLLKNCAPELKEKFKYEIRPHERGEYHFGNIQIFVSSILGMVSRRVTIEASETAKVYPSFIQLKKYSFYTINNRLEEVGVRKIRKLGLSNEFEQIREYVRGDDYRIINWKATARKNDFMVNQFQEEKSQHIYCLIDKGRQMHMPFDQLTLIDYAINAALVMSGVALGRGDKAGLISFSDKIGTFMPAQGRSAQMNSIADALYNQETRTKESDFLRLYKNVKVHLKKRSLLILFTNFDSLVSLHKQMKYLKALGKSHLLCTVIFDNTEINERADTKAYGLTDTYRQTIAEKFQHDKRSIIKELNKNGIYSILTEPQDLTINTINKYIQLKAMGAI